MEVGRDKINIFKDFSSLSLSLSLIRREGETARGENGGGEGGWEKERDSTAPGSEKPRTTEFDNCFFHQKH